MNLAELTWPAIAALPKSTPVVIPIAALEQHGHHLPVFTDSMLMGEVLRRAHEPLDGKILVTPLQWLGNSDHHLDFAGTMSASPRVYLDMLHSMVENIIAHGFKRIVVINGHGGNDVPAKQALFEVRQMHRTRDDLLLMFSTYWNLGTKPWEHNQDIYQRDMGHACEWETSMILRIAPHLVGPYRDLPEISPGDAFRPAYRAWITKDRTTPGHIGAPHLASEEKGELLFSLFAQDVQKLLERVIAWDGSSWNG